MLRPAVPVMLLLGTVNPGKAEALVLPSVLTPASTAASWPFLPAPSPVSSGPLSFCVALSWSLPFSGPPAFYCKLSEDKLENCPTQGMVGIEGRRDWKEIGKWMGPVGTSCPQEG